MVQPVSDDQLATEGMQLRNQGRVLLIACGADRPASRNRIGGKRVCDYDLASGVTDYGFRSYDAELGVG